MTNLAFKEIFTRLKQGTASQKEMDLFLEALQNQLELQNYLQVLLVEYFEQPRTGDVQEEEEEKKMFSQPQNQPRNQPLHQLLADNLEIINRRIEAEDNKAKGQEAYANKEEDKVKYMDMNKVEYERNDPVDKPTVNALPTKVFSYKQRNKRRFTKLAMAASILIILGLGIGVYLNTGQNARFNPASDGLLTTKSNLIQPGKSAAILTLDNGDQIPLDSNTTQNIQIKNQVIALNEGGRIKYEKGNLDPANMHYQTLHTRQGNRYQLVLPDGTKAWLNAESSIRFPSSFPQHQRTVSITGEVYFEVAHDGSRPFTVEVNGQKIRDIGTAFNVNAYQNEPNIKTTLVEGIIEVNNTRLEPGWQAAIAPNGKMHIDKHADIEEVISWKNNLFIFHQTSMAAILRQIARWYDVQIIYKGQFDQTFSGGISRETSLEELLKILSFSNKIKFEVHDRTITVQTN